MDDLPCLPPLRDTWQKRLGSCDLRFGPPLQLKNGQIRGCSRVIQGGEGVDGAAAHRSAQRPE